MFQQELYHEKSSGLMDVLVDRMRVGGPLRPPLFGGGRGGGSGRFFAAAHARFVVPRMSNDPLSTNSNGNPLQVMIGTQKTAGETTTESDYLSRAETRR